MRSLREYSFISVLTVVLTNVGRDLSNPKGFVNEQWISLLGSWIKFPSAVKMGPLTYSLRE